MGGSQYASGIDEAPSRIQLERMKQQQEVRNLKDDWTGVTNPAERRKLQNRLNQRIYRKSPMRHILCLSCTVVPRV
jgi:hypothetical protein